MADFNDGIFGCFSNTSICILGCLSPYFLFGKNVEKMGENPVLWMFGLATVPCLVGAYMRGLIRTKYVSSRRLLMNILKIINIFNLYYHFK